MLTAARTRVCIVNPFEHGGGAEYQISLLIDALADTGRYDIHYLTHFVDTRNRPRRYAVVRVGRGGGIPRLGYLAEAGSLYRALQRIDPSVIYQRVACGYTGICAFYARRRGVPMVWHVSHDTEVKRQHLDKARNVLRLRLEKWAVESGVRNAARIVVQTQHQAALLRENYGRSADAVIPNFHPPASEPIDKSGPLTVLWIANLKPWKRPEMFIQLAQRLKDRIGVRFVMVGGASASTTWQDALLADIQATPNLTYLGEIDQREVNVLLARAHIFVNTSVYEGFPNTFIQAWLRDVAVVSAQVDPDAALSGGGAGLVAGSQEGLERAVRRLIDSPAERQDLASRGRALALAQHSLNNAARLMRLLSEPLPQKG
ncbi:MAG: glycosyltransferase family 4 protein [Gammaproteobacteria bacterium]